MIAMYVHMHIATLCIPLVSGRVLGSIHVHIWCGGVDEPCQDNLHVDEYSRPGNGWRSLDHDYSLSLREKDCSTEKKTTFRAKGTKKLCYRETGQERAKYLLRY